MTLLPLTMVGPPNVGTAGVIVGFPFMEELDSAFPCDAPSAVVGEPRVLGWLAKLRPAAACCDVAPPVGGGDCTETTDCAVALAACGGMVWP